MNAESLSRTSDPLLPMLTRSGEFKLPRRTNPAVVVVSRPSQTLPAVAGPIVRPSVASSVRPSVVLLRVAAAALVLVAVWRIGFAERGAAHPAAAAETASPAPTVTVASPERAVSGEVVLPATIRPWQTTAIVARADGYITSWTKDLGAPVKAGDLLATLETPELDQQVAEAGAQAQEAVVAVAQAKAEREEAAAELAFAEAQRTRAQAEADLAESQLKRRHGLVATQAISQEEFDTFQKTVEARRADVAAAEADVLRRTKNIDTRTAVITAREATARSRQSNVRRLEELQGFKRIVAPFDGVVTARRAEVGMLITAGKDSLYTLDDMSRVRVQVNVPQAYAARTKPGSAATILVPETADKAEARVTRIAESVDATTRTMTAEIELANEARRFQPGSYVQVKLATTEETSPWTIPTNVLQMRIDGPHVAVVAEDGRLEVKRVGLGRDLGGRVVVVDGINGGERLVVNPRDEMTTGSLVRVAESAGAPAGSVTQSAE
jgi:multidrug efflux pump subunit AcrA (membrane-fusion protein)